jgi:aspartyl-tRNA(Asn)/glutamyl-tRNA(Gln) amidotransferase subunit C
MVRPNSSLTMAPGPRKTLGRSEILMSPSVDEKLIRHIGVLARIELTDEQVATFGRQFVDIVAYMDKLQELNTDGIEPMAHPLPIQNVLAEDVVVPSLSVEAALANAPDKDNNLYKVPKVIGESQ